MGKLTKKIEQEAAQRYARFQRMLASHGIEADPEPVVEVTDAAGPEAERQQLARQRDQRTGFGCR